MQLDRKQLVDHRVPDHTLVEREPDHNLAALQVGVHSLLAETERSVLSHWSIEHVILLCPTSGRAVAKNKL